MRYILDLIVAISATIFILWLLLFPQPKVIYFVVIVVLIIVSLRSAKDINE